MFAIFMLIGNVVGGQTGMIIAFVIALIMNGIAYFFSDSIALSMYKAVEVSYNQAPDLHRIVEELSKKAGIPKPRIYICDLDIPNAFATGRSPQNSAVAVTRGLLNILDYNELKGVLAHEIGHIVNRDILISSVAAILASAISMLAQMAYYAGFLFGGSSDDDDSGGVGHLLYMIVLAIITPILATLIQLAISRTREYGADEMGARLAGNPLFLANALYKLDNYSKVIPATTEEVNPAATNMLIINPFKGGGLLELLSTHPPIEKRIERLKEMARRGEY